MLAYKNDKTIKAKYLARVKAHEKADEIIQGTYWEDGKGCAVGCTIEGSDHSKYEKELGIPEEIAHVEDAIFEMLSNGEAKAFPAQFLSAIKVGADLSKVIPQLVIWQFEDKKWGLKNIKEVQEDKEVYGWCEEVVALYKRDLSGDKPTEQEYYDLYLKIDSARARAWAGAWARARARAWAGAGAGAWAGAWARARAWAGAGAWAGAWARARAWAGAGAGAWAERTLALRDEFLRLLKAAN